MREFKPINRFRIGSILTEKSTGTKFIVTGFPSGRQGGFYMEKVKQHPNTKALTNIQKIGIKEAKFYSKVGKKAKRL